ncbi:Zinc finger, C3HC4 RING-type [Dillenia turbinata]|uniref:Zinc finger, C3HC4 RING-type n=1 Tax=Dillenia turbinata TaxID=194707 RepID=A0AAN8VPP8_9MAGN
MAEVDGPPENDICSICRDAFNLPCQANCSHWFCGNCILRVWHYGSPLEPCKCPVCRRQITLLVPGEASLQRRHEPQASEILQRVERYNRMCAGGTTSFLQNLQDLPFFLRRLLRELMDPHRTLPLVLRARMALSAIYVLSPIDIIPEVTYGTPE